MTTTRKQYGAKFKARVATEAIRGRRRSVSSEFGVHAMQIAYWRKLAMEQLPALFADERQQKGRDSEVGKETLYEEIGRLKMELDWVKKTDLCSCLICRWQQHALSV